MAAAESVLRIAQRHDARRYWLPPTIAKHLYPPTPIKLGPPVFGSAIVERLAVRLMVAMCYQLSDRVVDELINELEAMQHA